MECYKLFRFYYFPQIEDILNRDGVTARGVNVIRERNGESRGFAFVEFDDIESAEKWIELRKVCFDFNNKAPFTR